MAEAWQAFENDLKSLPPPLKIAIKTTFYTGGTAAYAVLLRQFEEAAANIKAELDEATADLHQIKNEMLKGNTDGGWVQ